MVRATISYDPAVVNAVSYDSAGTWMESFGYAATFQVSKPGGNQVRIRVDSASGYYGAQGDGVILKLRFRRVSCDSGASRRATHGSSSPRRKRSESAFNENLSATHGGTITVR